MVEATLATSARVTSKDSLSDLFEPSTKSGQDHLAQDGQLHKRSMAELTP